MSWQTRTLLWQHFRQPVGAGSLSAVSFSAMAKSPAGGQVIELDVQVEGEGIAAAGFRCFGGVAYIASGSWLCERIIGLSAVELSKLLNAGGLQAELQEALQLIPTETPAAMLVAEVVQKLSDAWIV